MTKTAREILAEVLKAGATYGRDGRYFAGKSDIDQALKELEAIISERMIGGGEVHISHVCPRDSIPCREFHARGSSKNDQRQALQTALYGKEASCKKNPEAYNKATNHKHKQGMKQQIVIELTERELAFLKEIVSDIAFDASGLARISKQFEEKAILADSVAESIGGATPVSRV